jgi:hypothetical protein
MGAAAFNKEVGPFKLCGDICAPTGNVIAVAQHFARQHVDWDSSIKYEKKNQICVSLFGKSFRLTVNNINIMY